MPHEFTVDADRTVAYAKATNDPLDAHLSGELAPPVFAIVPVWEAIIPAATTVLPADLLPLLVHGEQDIVVHRPIVPGMRLRSQAKVVGVHPKSSGTSIVIRTSTVDDRAEPVNDQHVVLFVRTPFTPEGDVLPAEPAPAHDFDERLRSTPPVTVHARVDDDQTFRYAEASGDPMPIHLDAEVARAAGLPGIIVHGLCTMAFTSWAAIQVAGGDPRRLRRLAVRFSRPLLPGEEITTSFWPTSATSWQFETVSGAGSVVIRNGLAVFGG
ncbi:MAG: dehydratase [Hamadaea sp.]|nr:dehydratase [Hamadaea sp.]